MDKSPNLTRASYAAKVLIGLLTLSMLISVFYPNLFPISQQQASDWIKSHDHDELMFVSVQIAQVLIPPISHYFTSILGGYVYGAIDGGLLNWTGRVIGQFLAFFIAYYAGEMMRKKLHWDFSPFNKLLNGREGARNWRTVAIFTMIALPFFPDDELSYAMGFAKFNKLTFSIITITGHLLGSFALAFLGSGQEFKGPYFITLAAITFCCFAVLTISAIKIKRAAQDRG